MNKIEKLNSISYHDANIINYKKYKNDITIELKDGWEENTYYKIELKNVSIQIMKNKVHLVYYVLDEFNNINNSNPLPLYAGKAEKTNEKKYNLKLWIDYPQMQYIKEKNLINKYPFADQNIILCDDYDDTGRLFIKFIADDINVVNL